MHTDIANVNSSNSDIRNRNYYQQPSLSYYHLATQWMKETGKLAYEGLNEYTTMQIMGLWSAAAFGAAAATENKHSDWYNSTAVTAGAFAIFGGTYTILRNEAYRLRLSNRSIKIEQATVPPADKLREELKRTEVELTTLRDTLREKEHENALQQETIEALLNRLQQNQ